MMNSSTQIQSSTQTQYDATRILKQLEPLLAAARNSWSIGLGVFDRKLRYCFLNEALAAMHRLSVSEHLGVTVRAILAETAEKVEPMFDKVFSTGKAILHYEFSGSMPSRREYTHWMVSYFPVAGSASNVSQVAVVVLDMTIVRRVERRFAELLEPYHSAPPPSVDVNARQVNSRDTVEQIPEAMELSRLTSREIQILKLLASGNSNKEVALNLGLSARTVEGHRARIMLKLGLHSVSALVRFAVQSNVI